MSIKNNNIDHSKFLVSIVTITYNHQKYIINTGKGIMQEYRVTWFIMAVVTLKITQINNTSIFKQR